MKRYLLFAGQVYYPSGGWDDLRGNFDTLEDCHEIINLRYTTDDYWWHIIDTTTWTKITVSE